MEEETTKNNNKPWLFKEGNEGGPGRTPDTPEQKLEKKALKVIIKEYKEALADMLPEIQPILRKKALEGDMTAIKEVHDRVMDKSRQNVGIDGGAEGVAIIFDRAFKEDATPS